MSKHFVSEPLQTAAQAPGAGNEPALPDEFEWREERLAVGRVLKTWRSTKEDRGDVYLKRHWFAFETSGNRIATVYFDRTAKRGQPHWWLYTLESSGQGV